MRDRGQARLSGHVDVEDQHARPVLEHLLPRHGDIARLAEDLEPVLRVEQHAQAGAHDLVVVGEHDRDRGASGGVGADRR